MQADKKVYSPLMRKHAATVSNLHYPTVDVASNGDVRVTINNHSPAPPAPPETETETDKTEVAPAVMRNKHHEGLVRQRSRSEADILGLIDALKMLEEGTLSEARPNSASTNKDGKTRKTSGGGGGAAAGLKVRMKISIIKLCHHFIRTSHRLCC